MPLVIGVTGSIAAGKSFLSSELAERYGAIHVDADREVHQLYAPGTPGFDRVVGEFGAEIVGADGVIDRKILGAKVFGNAERMAALRTAIGDIPAHFRAMVQRWRTELAPDAVAVFEAVNLLENDYMRWADAAWLVVCEPDTAVARMVANRGLTEDEARQRLASAKDWRERAPFADRVIHNDGSLDDYRAAITSAVAELFAARQTGPLPTPAWCIAHPLS